MKVLEVVLMGLMAFALVCLPFAIWGLIMMFITWLMLVIYTAGPQVIFGWPDIGYWPLFFTLWFISLVGSLVFKRGS